jgi:hypothetical protein
MSRAPVLTGGCQCGKVRYALYAEPQGAFCHCRMCQRATGGVFAALAWAPKADFSWTKGEPAVFASSNLADRAYCRDCGTPLTFTYHHTDGTNVTMGSLDDPERANMTMHHGVEPRVSWLKLCDGLPEERTGDEDNEGRLRAMVSRQGAGGAA